MLILSGGRLKKINDFLFGKNSLDISSIIEKLIEIIRRNRLKLLLFILISSIFTVIMVSNVRNIDKQLVKVRQYEKELKAIKNSNKVLRTQITELESPERIIPIAKEKLGMINNKEIPRKIILSD